MLLIIEVSSLPQGIFHFNKKYYRKEMFGDPLCIYIYREDTFGGSLNLLKAVLDTCTCNLIFLIIAITYISLLKQIFQIIDSLEIFFSYITEMQPLQ